MVKPDGVQRGLVGDIISRFERKGFKVIGLKMFQTPKDVAEEHYKDLSSKPFYGALVEYIVSGPVVCMVRCGCWLALKLHGLSHVHLLRGTARSALRCWRLWHVPSVSCRRCCR
jgi:Nucleoside diphosphate kinase